MFTNKNWIPVENNKELEVVDKVLEEKRTFHKQLRYNLASDKPIACLTLTDVAGNPCAVYLDLEGIVSKWASRESMKELISTSTKTESWIFDPRIGWRDFPPSRFRSSGPPPAPRTQSPSPPSAA